MKQSKYYSSKLKYIGLLLISIVFVAIGTFMVTSGEEVVMGWLCGGFFFLGIPIFLRQIFDFRPRLVLTESGVLDRTLGVGEIDWKDIRDINVRSVQNNDFICLEMDEASNEKYLSKISSFKRRLVTANVALGFTPLNLNLSGISGSTEGICSALVERMEQVSKGNHNVK